MIQNSPPTAVTAGAVRAAALSEKQNEIYLRGMAGQLPAYPVGWRDLEERAAAVLSDDAAGYVLGGAGGEDTMRANREAFDRWRILPRMLRGITSRDLSTTLLGTAMPAPVLLAPIGVQQAMHPDGERATARAAASLGIPYIHSTAATTSIEDAAEANGAGPRWFQLYWPRDRSVATSFVRRAEAAGYTAVVLTVDTWTLAWRPRDLARAFLPFLRGVGIQNYLTDPAFLAGLPDERPESVVAHWAAMFGDPALTWEDIAWLRDQTSLPVVIKGLSSAEDAVRAVDVGVDAIVVSNHGGRQVDGAVATLDVLPDVVDAVDGRVPVLLDSGIRTGADAVKALALGASAVLLGRPYVYGLALGGEEGVREVVQMFLGELDNTLALSGHARPSELSRETLVPKPRG